MKKIQSKCQRVVQPTRAEMLYRRTMRKKLRTTWMTGMVKMTKAEMICWRRLSLDVKLVVRLRPTLE